LIHLIERLRRRGGCLAHGLYDKIDPSGKYHQNQDGHDRAKRIFHFCPFTAQSAALH
jgi:hypothetical protein